MHLSKSLAVSVAVKFRQDCGQLRFGLDLAARDRYEPATFPEPCPGTGVPCVSTIAKAALDEQRIEQGVSQCPARAN